MGVVQGVGVARGPSTAVQICVCTKEALQWWLYLHENFNDD